MCRCIIGPPSNHRLCSKPEFHNGFCFMHYHGGTHPCKDPVDVAEVVVADAIERKEENDVVTIIELDTIPDIPIRYESVTLSKDILHAFYSKMETDGFFNILEKDKTVVSFPPDYKYPSVQWNQCQDRRQDIKFHHDNEFGMKFYKTTCRLGRNLTLCNGYVDTKEHTINVPQKDLCILCLTIRNAPNSPCLPFRAMKFIASHGFLLFPNAFPYFPMHFLITTMDHTTQDAIATRELLLPFGQIVQALCMVENDTIFFNGMCGNSMDHFHAHYVEFPFPIYPMLHEYTTASDQKITFTYQSECRIYLVQNFRGWITGLLLHCKEIQPIMECMHMFISSIGEIGATSNFIIHKKGSIYECILFVRRIIPQSLNYGANELGGIVAFMSEKQLPDTKKIELYLKASNRIEDVEEVLSRTISTHSEIKIHTGRRNKKKQNNQKKHNKSKHRYVTRSIKYKI
jgi:hypothetical protein